MSSSEGQSPDPTPELVEEVENSLREAGLTLERERTIKDIDELNQRFKGGEISPRDYTDAKQTLEYRLANIDTSISGSLNNIGRRATRFFGLFRRK